MPRLELTVAQIIELIRQLPPKDKFVVMTALNADLPEVHELNEDREWLEADSGTELPPYDWGTTDIPQGQSVHYIPAQGWVVEGEKKVVQ